MLLVIRTRTASNRSRRRFENMSRMSAQRHLFFLYQFTISHEFSLLFEYFASIFRVALFKKKKKKFTGR